MKFNFLSPMILFGTHCWQQMSDGKGVYLPKSKDAWNLLRVLEREKGFEHLIACTDDTDEILRRIEGYVPQHAPVG